MAAPVVVSGPTRGPVRRPVDGGSTPSAVGPWVRRETVDHLDRQGPRHTGDGRGCVPGRLGSRTHSSLDSTV